MNDMKTIHAPTVHMNGTSRSRLTDDLTEALGALNRVTEALGVTAPNARDYYPQGDGAILRAVEEHSDRLTRLESIGHEIVALIEAIDDDRCGEIPAVPLWMLP
jgi:hypothetical protein